MMMIVSYTYDDARHDFHPDNDVDNGRIVHASTIYDADEIFSRNIGQGDSRSRTHPKQGWLGGP